MTSRTAYAVGEPCWIAQLSPDVHASARFYSSVFGWEFQNVAPHDAPPFLIASLRGHRVASLAGPEQAATWITAIAVDDLDRAVGTAIAAAGSAPGAPAAIKTVGRFRKLLNPVSAEIHIAHIDGQAVALRDEPGAWSTSTLITADLAAVASFYTALFGWETEQHDGDVRLTGTRQVGSRPAPAPRTGQRTLARVQSEPARDARWVPDFRVDDIDSVCATVTAHGGRALTAPSTDSHRRVELADPFGARFTITGEVGADRPRAERTEPV